MITLVCIFKGDKLVFSFTTYNCILDLENLGFVKVDDKWINSDGNTAYVYAKET